jgi:two-component system, OmpR family, sensor kinase
VSRIPIRLRVTLVFAAVMAVVFVAVGLFLYLRLGSQLDESIDNGLRTRGGEISALVQASGSALEGSGDVRLIEAEESFAQVLSVSGEVLDSTPQLEGSPVLDPAAVGAALAEPTFFERESLPGVEGPARLLATPVEAADDEVVAVVGSSLDDRSEALSSLATTMLIGGPVALLLASLAGYGAAAGALRPVESMRRRAETISAGGPDARLPVPPAQDELTRLGETLNEMLARLGVAIERERRFTDDAAHELRTPLTLHRSELELALRYGKDEAELRAAITSSIGEVDRLVQLAEDLLVVARSEQGRLALAPGRVRAGELMHGVRERFAARAAEAGRELVVGEGAELELECDRLRLEQALTNLLDNALRHGGGEVRLWAEDSRGGVRFHVADAGPGFPSDFAPRAFERFSRADPARGRGGSGLGLAIVATIAAAHRGAVGVSEQAAGTDVWIEVPEGASGSDSGS